MTLNDNRIANHAFFTGSVPVDEVPTADERIILPDRGVGRDLGQNPTFQGRKPQTRQDTRPDPRYAVGGYGVRDEQVTTFQANAVQFGGVNGMIVQGAGALRGISFGSLTADVRLFLRSGSNLNAPIIFGGVATVNEGYTRYVYFGDFGIGFNNLWVSFPTTPPADFFGIAHVASTE